jgi:hypothetical protein
MNKKDIPASFTLGIGKQSRIFTIKRKKANGILRRFAEEPTIRMLKQIYRELKNVNKFA